MKWCVIGAGGIADRRTIPAKLKDKDNVIVALMDRSEAVAKKTGEKYDVSIIRTKKKCLPKTSATPCISALPYPAI